MDNLRVLIEHLKGHPDVVGLVRYGSRIVDDDAPGGDFDLIAFLNQRPARVESLHFRVGGIPVDLSLREMGDLRRDKPLTMVDMAITSGEILYDASDKLSELLAAARRRWQLEAPALTEHDIAFIRFSQRHALDKVRHRLASDPLLAEFLLATNIFWLIQNYFRVRGIIYEGEKAALNWLRDHNPVFYATLWQFYAVPTN